MVGSGESETLAAAIITTCLCSLSVDDLARHTKFENIASVILFYELYLFVIPLDFCDLG